MRVWDLKSNNKEPLKLTKTSKERVFTVYSSAFSPSGHYLAAACQDEIIRIWDLSKPERAIEKFEGHNDEVRAVKFLDEDSIVSGGGDNSLRIWKLRLQDRPPSQQEQSDDLDLLLNEACKWLDDDLRTNRNLDLGDRYICTDI